MTRPLTRVRTAARLAAFVVALVAMLLVATPAQAQLHWDASAQVGAMKRVLGNRPSGGDDTLWGPAGQLTGHIALLPLVRVGAYFGHDISPFDGKASARDITWGGLRAKIMSPWPRGDGRVWLFFGFGYAGVYQRSTSPAEASSRCRSESVHLTCFASRGSSASSSVAGPGSTSPVAFTGLGRA